MNRRGLRYWTLRAVWAWTYRVESDGIEVGILWPDENDRNLHIPKVIAALNLIRQLEPYRYPRLRREVISVNLLGFRFHLLGEWFDPLRMILLAPDWVQAPERKASEIAGVIIHEATHARLHRFGYGEAIRARIERRCHYEEWRFVVRSPDAAEFAASVRRSMDRDPKDWTNVRMWEHNLDALRKLGWPEFAVRILDRLRRGAVLKANR